MRHPALPSACWPAPHRYAITLASFRPIRARPIGWKPWPPTGWEGRSKSSNLPAPGWPCRLTSARGCRWAFPLGRSASWASMRLQACAPGTSRRESCCGSGRSTFPTLSGFCRIGRCCANWSRWAGTCRFSRLYVVGTCRDDPPLAMSRPGEPGAASAGPLLGWNTWLPTSRATPRRRDANDALFEGEIVEGRA